MKFVIWLVLIGVVVYLLRGKKIRRAAEGVPAVESMVQCAQCGLHLPASEGISDGQGTLFCSAAHRALGPGG